MKIFATHSGPFHADDVLSAALLLHLVPKATLVRSRDPKDWAKADILFDVGQEFAPSENKFDHHFLNAPKRTNQIEYSSLGLLWERFGRQYLTSLGLKSEKVERAWNQVDSRFIQGLDAIDTGTIHQSKDPEARRAVNRARGIASAVRFFNNTWLEDESRDIDTAFKNCVQLVGMPILKAICLNPMGLDYQTILKRESIQQRELAHKGAVDEAAHLFWYYYQKSPSKDLVILDKRLPWQDIVTQKNAPELKFVVYPSDGAWRCQTVPTEPNGFAPRCPLPETWLGAVDFQETSGIQGATFCHPSGFVMGGKTPASCAQLAQKAIKTHIQPTERSIPSL